MTLQGVVSAGDTQQSVMQGKLNLSKTEKVTTQGSFDSSKLMAIALFSEKSARQVYEFRDTSTRES